MTPLEATGPTHLLSVWTSCSNLMHLKRKLLFVPVRKMFLISSLLTGKGGKFSGGFDISSFGNLHSGQSMLC
jgi:hypothetical protein